MVSLIFLHHGRVCPFFSVFFFFFLSFLTSIGEIIITYAQEIPSARLGVKKKNQKKKEKNNRSKQATPKEICGFNQDETHVAFHGQCGQPWIVQYRFLSFFWFWFLGLSKLMNID